MYRLFCSPLEEVIDQFLLNYKHVLCAKTTQEFLNIYYDNDILNVYHTLIIVVDILNSSINRELLKKIKDKFYYIVLVGKPYEIQYMYKKLKK